MTCKLCGYMMTAFDVECPRCHGKGLPDASTPSAQTPAAPVQPAWPQTQAPPTWPQQGQSPVPSAWPTSAPGIPPAPPVQHNAPNTFGAPITEPLTETAGIGRLMFFVMSGLAYCLGFLAPWASVSWFGFSMSFNGGSGLELFAVVAAIAAVGLGVWESVLSERGKITLLRILLCAGCFAFAVGEGVYFGFLTHIMQFGFGLALMILAGGICLYIAINDAPPSVGRNLLPLSIAAIVCAGGFAAYKGHAARESTNFANIFNGFGGAGSMDDVTADLTPKTRDDVTIQLNSTREVWVLEPESQWDGNRTPAPGKAFLVCNVTVAYKGTSGELGVYGTAIRMQGSDKKVYDDYTFLENAKTINKLSATLLPGGTAMGDVVFEVTPGTKPDKLEFLANPPMF